jgi:hypothetical protein
MSNVKIIIYPVFAEAEFILSFVEGAGCAFCGLTALVLSLSKDILERSKKSFNKFRTSA